MIEIKGKYCKDIKVFTDNIEEEALASLYRISESLGFKDKKIRVMPDVHQGKGNAVIGFSCPIDIEKDNVNPEYIGCDIGCTVSVSFFTKPIPTDKIKEFEHKLKNTIPMGFAINEKKNVDVKTIIKEFNSSLHKLASCYPLFSSYIPSFNEERDLEKWCDKIRIDYGTFLKSIGTVGGGNHYLEYDESDDGKYGVCVHCGSRNLGLKVFSYWNNIAKSMTVSKEEMRLLTDEVKSKNKDKRKLNEEIKAAKEEYLKDKIPGFINGSNLIGYLIDVCLAQTYAKINHMVIHSQIEDIYKKLSDGGKKYDEIYTTHNYIDYDFKALSGTPNMMIRKGAIRAYSGERCIIPFNMKEGISICEGKSNEDWNFTAPHGCGRCLSRTKAHQQLNVEDFKATMEAAGVYTTTADASTLDEAPEAYKPYEEIVKLIEPTVNILFFMKPKINIKASM